MSKKLKSIMDTLPSATAKAPLPSPQTKVEFERNKLGSDEKLVRIVASVPFSLKQEIRRYIIDNPEDTEKSIILKGLRKMGFDVPEEYLVDNRGKQH